MLWREIDDKELADLDAGTSVLSLKEQVEGLRARLRRLETAQAIAEEQRQRCRANAVEEAKRRGGPYLFNRWRDWEGTPFDYGDVCAAIVEALTQEGVQAWLGDGTSIVTQMVEAGHTRAVKAETEREAALGKLDAAYVVETALRNHIRDLEATVDVLIQVLTDAKVGEHAWDCPANGRAGNLARCDCSHPESNPLALRVNAVLAAAKTLRK